MIHSCRTMALFAFVFVPLLGRAETKDSSPLRTSKEEQAILELTNLERQKEKLPRLVPNPILFKVARAHSANMARKEEMNHVLDGKNPAQRVDAAGYDYGYMGENIAYSDNPEVKIIFQGWLDSPHHRENILNNKFQEIGIGIASNDKGEVYYTQVFGSRRKGN